MATTPPNMITPKDRLYLEDLLNVTLVYHKKAKVYCNMVSDTTTRKKLMEVSTLLAYQYDELINLLGTGSKQKATAVSNPKTPTTSATKGGKRNA